MSESPAAPARFRCTPGGAIAAGRRRLGQLLSVLASLMLAAAISSWVSGRAAPGLLALLVAFIILTAWRLSGELQPRWLELEDGELRIQTSRRQIEISIVGATVRRLDKDEIVHLERLASTGGFVAGAGGFDSHQLGEFDLYASNLANSLLVTAPEHRMVLTPDLPDAFLEVCLEMASVPPARILTP